MLEQNPSTVVAKPHTSDTSAPAMLDQSQDRGKNRQSP
jgi:hypothetical protein